MQNKKYMGIILNLFDGSDAGAAADDGTGGGDGESTSAGGISSEARARGRELGLSDDLMEDYQKAFYGNGNRGKSSQGSAADSGNAEGAGATENKSETGQDDLDARFDELVKGEFKEAFQKRVGKQIQDRFAKSNREKAELEQKAGKADKLMSLLAEKYGNADPDALYDAVRNDNEMWRQQAIDKGQTAEEFLEGYDQRQAAAAQQRELEELRQFKQATELDNRFRTLAKSTQELYPDFNMEAEFQNPRFRQALDFIAAQNEQHNKQTGQQNEIFDLTYAYELAHADELRENVIKRTAKAAAGAAMQTIRANRQRPAENAGRPTAPAQRISYRDMTDEQFEAELARVKAGEARIHR